MKLTYTLSEINTVCPEFTDFGDHSKELFAALLEKCKKDNGLGLSANQVGLTDRVFVVSIRGLEYAAFNPSFEAIGDETILVNEGCLSYPGLWLHIKRPVRIRAKFQDENGEPKEKELEKMESRVFQHETDHLNGVPFIEKVSKFKLDRAFKARAKTIKRIYNHYS